MAFTGNFMCTSFKLELMSGVHAISASASSPVRAADTFKIALYTSSATLNDSTTVYSATNSVNMRG